MPEIPDSLAAALADRYTLEKELGRGGMATVYLARDLRHDRPVALKVLEPALAAALGTDRFLREIKLAARLQHPHILSVLDSGEAAGQVWFTMPAVSGGSLRQRLDREAQLPLDDAVRITTQVASALAFAHQDGIVHRDVKPENILLSGDQCMLADFGIARAVHAAGAERLTETGITVGTPAYMSPEQATADPHLDGRSDIYSLGCVVYEMLAGEPPFTGPTAQAILARRLTAAPPRLGTIRDVPEQVERVVMKALARAPADRFTTADEIAAALRDAAGAGGTVRSAAAPRARSRRTLVLAAGAALVIAALALAMYPRLRPAATRTLEPNLLAFAPFDVFDPALEVWREGLGDILSRTLDGAGPLRTVPPSVALQRWEGRADRASAEALGLRTGAGIVVFGGVLPRGRDSVTLRASVLDRVGTPQQADLEVSGDAARVGELADSLGIAILRALSRTRPIASVRQVTIGSRSLPALKAFLQGEQFYRRGAWDSALTRYDQATIADTTFALAHRRMGLVLGWGPPTADAYRPAEEYARRATRWNHGLSPKDSLLIAADSLAFAGDDAADPSEKVALRFRALAANEEATRRFPGDPEVWYLVGEAHVHAAYPVAPLSTTLAMFERSIALDSGFGPAYEHMPQLTLQMGRVDLARNYAIAYSRLNPDSSGAGQFRLLARLLDPDPSDSLTTNRMIDSASTLTMFNLGLLFSSVPDSAGTAVTLFRRIGTPGRPRGGSFPWIFDSLMWSQYLGVALADRGHLREAYEANRVLLIDPGASPFTWFLDRFLDFSLLGIIPDSMARVTFDRAFEPGARWGNSLETPRHLRGLPWWLARRDTTSLRRFAARAAEVSRHPETPWVALRSRLLGGMAEGYLSLARGDSAEALRRLTAVSDTLCIADDYAPNCFHLRMTESRLLAARGEYRRAADLLEVWRWDAGGPLFVLATLELGRLAERLGDREKAIDSYEFVTAMWRRADPELQPYVAEAQEALARLARQE